MKRALVILLILCTQVSVFAADVSVFEGGMKEAVAELGMPGHAYVINISLPADCHVVNATMKVTGVSPDTGNTNGLEEPKVYLDDTVIWAFNGTGYGGLENQTMFADGGTELKLACDSVGGTSNGKIRLMKDAVIQNATALLTADGPSKSSELARFSQGLPGDEFGLIVTGVGDVNKDGFDDMLVGAPYNSSYRGTAYLFLGGSTISTTPAWSFTAQGTYFQLGWSVCDKCDFNGDGYDDLIMGVPGWGGYAGRVVIFWGGPTINTSIPDMWINGFNQNELFGRSVACPGDINGDGYDDLLVGCPRNGSSGDNSGATYVFFGGPAVDDQPDVSIYGLLGEGRLGNSVSGAGDLNGDGIDDFVLGAIGYYCTTAPGHAYVFDGRKSWPSTIDTSSADLILTGENIGDGFGDWVSSAGDVNGDGYSDVIVGADYAMSNNGSAYIYYGGKNMDNTPDVLIRSHSAGEQLGYAAEGIGDINDDGYGDVLVGAENLSSATGAVYLYFGGAAMDNVSDDVYYGTAADSYYGQGLSSAGDVNKDGLSEFITSGCGSGSTTGYATVNCRLDGMRNATLDVGSGTAFFKKNMFNGSRVVDIKKNLTEYLQNAVPDGTDVFGNAYVDVPVCMTGEGCLQGDNSHLTLSGLSIDYCYTANIPDFSGVLNSFLSAHRGDKDQNGNITVPFRIVSNSDGRLKLLDLNIALDQPLKQVKQIPDIGMDEDTAVSDLVDLWGYFSDDYDNSSQLTYGLVSDTNGTIVNVSIVDNRHLSVDSATGPQNDNWTGTVDIVVKASDRWNLTVQSNQFRVTVRNVPDPPVMTSTPVLNATAGVAYSYNVNAVDGDNDILTYGLAMGPPNMTLDPSSGMVSWMPTAGGKYTVSVSVTDGMFTAFQNFTITVPDRPPVFSTNPPTNATAGVPYSYSANATDPDKDPLIFSLVTAPPGMTVDNGSGRISWVPNASGYFTARLKVSDGKGGEAFQEFILQVAERVKPRANITAPQEGMKVKGKLTASGTATKGTLDIVKVQVRLDSGQWTDIAGNATWQYQIDTGKLKNGKHTLEARAYDGMDYSDAASHTFTVDNAKASRTPGPGILLVLAAVASLFVLRRQRSRKTS